MEFTDLQKAITREILRQENRIAFEKLFKYSLDRGHVKYKIDNKQGIKPKICISECVDLMIELKHVLKYLNDRGWIEVTAFEQNFFYVCHEDGKISYNAERSLIEGYLDKTIFKAFGLKQFVENDFRTTEEVKQEEERNAREQEKRAREKAQRWTVRIGFASISLSLATTALTAWNMLFGTTKVEISKMPYLSYCDANRNAKTQSALPLNKVVQNRKGK